MPAIRAVWNANINNQKGSTAGADCGRGSSAPCMGLSPYPPTERAPMQFYGNSGLWKTLLQSRIQDKVSSYSISPQDVGFSCLHLFKNKYLLSNNYVA